jgi:hypothetical protein
MPRSIAIQSARSASRLRASLQEICRSEYRGRWVALDNVRYCPSTSKPIEAEVVDADDDLASLCQRMRESDRHACCVLLCDEGNGATPPSPRRRALH